MPICFEIQINDEQAVLAGSADISVLTAIVTFVSQHNELDVRVGGLVDSKDLSHEHVEWIDRSLKLGDHLTVRVVDASEPAPPVRRHVNDAEIEAAEERKYYEHLKRKFEP